MSSWWERVKPGDTTIRLTYEELTEELTRMELARWDDSPRPPVKRTYEKYEEGLFSASVAKETEWDTRCPNYLARLEAWQKAQSLPKKLMCAGPYGILDVEIIP